MKCLKNRNEYYTHVRLTGLKAVGYESVHQHLRHFCHCHYPHLVELAISVMCCNYNIFKLTSK